MTPRDLVGVRGNFGENIMTVSTTTLEEVAALTQAHGSYRTIYYGAAMRNNLFLGVMHTGKRVWFAEGKDSNGRRFRRKLGEHPSMDLAAARHACVRVCAEIAAGSVPATSSVREQTLGQVFVEWGNVKCLSEFTLKNTS